MSRRPDDSTVKIRLAGPANVSLPAEADTGGLPMRLGDWLVRRELIQRRDLFVALEQSYQRGCRVGDALVALQLIDRERVEQEVRAFTAFTAFTVSCHPSRAEPALPPSRRSAERLRRIGTGSQKEQPASRRRAAASPRVASRGSRSNRN